VRPHVVDTLIRRLYHDFGSIASLMRPNSSLDRKSVGRSCRGALCGDGLAARRATLLLALLFGLLLRASDVQAQALRERNSQGYVSDSANVLGQPARDQLAALLTELDQKAQAQIAVVTVKTLGGRPIEDYSIELATRLGVGPKGSNRGVLILLAVDDHRYRFEVGYGLEAILPDGKVGGFGREALPYLRRNNYEAALLLMARRVAEVIAADRGVRLSGAPLPPPASEQGEGGRTVGSTLPLLFVLFIVYGIIRATSRGVGSPRGGWWIGPMMGTGFRQNGWGGGFGGGGGSGGFGGGSFGGGGASGSW
jgi:uncharacterized protein